MPSRRALTSVLSTAAVAVALAGCGASTADQVKAKVRQFGEAAAAHDYTIICTQVLAPQLLADIADGGLTCERALQEGLASVRGARLVIGPVTLTGKRASVVTLTQAKGEKTTLATLELTDTAQGWRITSLGNAA